MDAAQENLPAICEATEEQLLGLKSLDTSLAFQIILLGSLLFSIYATTRQREGLCCEIEGNAERAAELADVFPFRCVGTAMTQYQKARVYYTWICQNCVYDYSATENSLSHTAYALFQTGTAVCDGYTGAYNLLLKLEGIDCTALSNDEHIWTVATLDGTVYHIDTTWGDSGSSINYTYFGMTLASLRRKGRIAMELSHRDRRRVKVFLSDEGLRLAGEKQEQLERYFDRMIAGLGEEDAAALISLIDRCVQVMEV